jgi:hypothetical protein
MTAAPQGRGLARLFLRGRGRRLTTENTESAEERFSFSADFVCKDTCSSGRSNSLPESRVVVPPQAYRQRTVGIEGLLASPANRAAYSLHFDLGAQTQFLAV